MAITTEDFKEKNGTWAKYCTINGVRYVTKSYRLWSGMKSRCKAGGSAQILRPTYKGCICDFLDFQEFSEWVTKQVGYSKDSQLDKDLLVKHNKVYSPSTCLLLPREINLAILLKASARGDLPIGVTYISRSIKFRASISIFGKINHLGSFDTPEEAWRVYRDKKHNYLKDLANKWKDQIDPRAYKALMNYEVLITD